MRIGFDLRPAWAKNSRHRGIGKYTFQLGRALSQMDHGHEFIFLGQRGEPVPEWAKQVVPLHSISRPNRLNWLLDSWQLPRILNRLDLDLFEATDIVSIPTSGAPRICVHVHDLIPYLFWDQARQAIPWDYRLALKTARKRFWRSDMLIVSSLHTQLDILDTGFPEERVCVVYPACDPHFRPLNRQQSQGVLAEHYRVFGDFLLYVGGGDFRKNLPRLVDAFAQLRSLGFGGQLVLAGESFLWNIAGSQELREAARRAGIWDQVVFPGYVPDEDLPHFFAACHAFVFPSLYEGFGLPVLEALQCEAVVAASQTTSIPEVGGDAVEYFDPTRVESILEALRRVCFDDSRRAQLRQAARRRQGRFSWKKSAEQILDLYQRLG